MPVPTPQETLETADLPLDGSEDAVPTEVSPEKVLEALYDSVLSITNLIQDSDARTQFLLNAERIFDSEDPLDKRITSMRSIGKDLYKLLDATNPSQNAEAD